MSESSHSMVNNRKTIKKEIRCHFKKQMLMEAIEKN